MKHAKGTHCTLKTPGNWPDADHAAVLQAYRTGEAVIYHGHHLEEGEKRARDIRALLAKLPQYPAHPTWQEIANPCMGFRTQTTQTGLMEWKVVLKTGPYTKGWLNAFLY